MRYWERRRRLARSMDEGNRREAGRQDRGNRDGDDPINMNCPSSILSPFRGSISRQSTLARSIAQIVQIPPMRSPFPLLAPWGNKNWPPSMKMKKLKIFWNKTGSMGCKWSSLNAPGTENPLSHSILKLDEPPFPLLAWGNKNWPPRMKVKKLEIFWNKMDSMGCKWSSLNTPGTENPLSHSILKLDESPFPIISPLG